MADVSADGAGGLQLRLLGSTRDLDGAELPDLYGYPTDHDGVWLRANFIASLDGGATVGGTTGRLGGPGDRALFSLLRELADVILVGAGTVRVEDYSGARPTVAQRHRRQARGQSEVPQLAIVTKSGRLERDMVGVHSHGGAAAGVHLRGGRRSDPARARRPRGGSRVLGRRPGSSRRSRGAGGAG